MKYIVFTTNYDNIYTPPYPFFIIVNMTFKLKYFTFLLFPLLSYSQINAKVVGIKDGDTIVVLLENKT